MSAAEAVDAVDAPPASAFSRTTVIAMLLAGIFSFCTLAVLASFAPDLRQGGDPRAHALSKSAVGFGGMVKLLQLQGEQVVISRSRTAPSNRQALLILTPDASVRAVEVNRLADPSKTLLILPKWRIGPDLRSPDWVTRAGLEPGQDILKGPLGMLKGVSLIRRKDPATVTVNRPTPDGAETLGLVRIDNLQSLSGADLVPIITDETGAILLAGFKDDEDLILADPDLLNTYALRDLNGAKVARAVLDAARPGPGPVFFDVTLNGYERGRNLWKLAFTPPFLAATLCALAAGLLMGLHAAVRFGPARREQRAIGMGKRALADNQAGLIRMAKREHRMAEPYARLIRDRAAREIGAGQVADESQLEVLLDRLGQRRTEFSIAALGAEARQVADPSGLLRLARRLYQWKLEISRERH